jgi:hypothetical protein
MKLHAGTAEAPVDPPVIAIDPRGSRNLDITVRNHSNEIRTFAISAESAGVTFSPARTEISIGPAMQRVVSLRVFAERPGLHNATIRLTGHGEAEEGVRLLAVPRNQAVAWQADLDGDGIAEHVLENQRARAVFSTAGGRWLEFVWKDTGQNVLPEQGALTASQRVRIEAVDHELRFRGPGWTRTAALHPAEPRLSLEQSSPLPDVRPAAPPGLRVEAVPEGPDKTVFRIHPANP